MSWLVEATRTDSCVSAVLHIIIIMFICPEALQEVSASGNLGHYCHSIICRRYECMVQFYIVS